jgi:hypothetical protein
VMIEWLGKKRQKSSISISKDLRVNNNINISVKTNSDVIFNLSPHNLFNSLPSGKVMVTKAGNWYFKAAPREYQELYNLYATAG